MMDTAKRRGPPRAFDADAVLDSARRVFWEGGFSGSSLDDLAGAMAMNRPSLYGAFGDKQALYLKTLERYRDESLVLMHEVLDPKRSLREGLSAVYAGALAVYFAQNPARGCFLIGTAATEAVVSAPVRDLLRGSLIAFDKALERRFQIARESGEIDATADPAMLARLASAILHSLAVRARAGEDKADLEALAQAGAAMICGRAGGP
jgi:AcrR family transcriptional regulator